jgi:hypothetical protein
MCSPRDSPGEGPCDDRDQDGSNGYHVPTELQDQLMIMGFPEEWCALALRENSNDIITASSWIVDNLDMLTRLSEIQKSSGDNESGDHDPDIDRENDGCSGGDDDDENDDHDPDDDLMENDDMADGLEDGE